MVSNTIWVVREKKYCGLNQSSILPTLIVYRKQRPKCTSFRSHKKKKLSSMQVKACIKMLNHLDRSSGIFNRLEDF